MLTEAMEFILRGWAIFPVHHMFNRKCSCGNINCKSAAKHPLVRHGFNDATNDINQIREWWNKWPSANIGVATGAISNIVVIDIDPKSGGHNSLQNILRFTGEQESTLIAQSGGHRDGRHYYYMHPGGVIRTIDGIRPGIDIKADKGCINAPPSVHQSGRTYRWLNNEPIAKLPGWVFQIIHDRKVEKYNLARQGRGGVDLDNISKMSEGKPSRNCEMLRICGKLKYINKSFDEAKEFLLDVNKTKCVPPLDEKEILGMLRRIYRSRK